MAAVRHRVVQWATGNTGQRALREVIRHPGLELVGVRVYDPAKNGVDAGQLCGEPATGVRATTDRDAVLKLDADCCIYMPRATGTGQTRAGLTERGTREARWLLKELFDYARGRRSGWGISRVSADGRWTDIAQD